MPSIVGRRNSFWRVGLTIILPDHGISGLLDHGDGSVPLGYYQHYKGPYYQLLAIATHSEDEQPYAVYRALYGDYSLWVRPLSMFSETVLILGEEVARFQFVGTERPA
ncbi:MAG: DUF1653 domain-containing protein [Gammaproteobacteria bacterium]|nr:DUF1653 domain-containing protein [Gammaproteobacteria bacterium]MBU2279232.1 DUF1653 domain-containing protein [Gammaproteobacteria bacterium]